MDPITIIGAASAVVSVVDVVTRTVDTLREIHNTWKDASMTQPDFAIDFAESCIARDIGVDLLDSC